MKANEREEDLAGYARHLEHFIGLSRREGEGGSRPCMLIAIINVIVGKPDIRVWV